MIRQHGGTSGDELQYRCEVAHAQVGDRARAEELVNLGKKCYKKREYGQAIEYFTEAIRLDPEFATAYNNRGNGYLKRGDYNRAIADYDQAIRLDPKFAKAYNNRGNAYLEKGDRARAELDFAEAKRLDPKYGEVRP